MATASQWVEGARPKTLPAAVAPVIVGTGAAAGLDAVDPLAALLCALLALALQVAVNYANDYSDGVRGTDEVRTGPMRLVGSGAASPAAVKRAALLSGLAAALIGVALCAYTERWWLLVVGAVSLVAAWGYTGGRRPYGYLGLGEVMVFVFFGLVATAGTTYAQAGTVSAGAWLGAIAIGSLACALLMVNNIRDVRTDAPAGKHTLAVRLGEERARAVFAGTLLVPFVAALGMIAVGGAEVPLRFAPILVLTALGPAIRLGQIVRAGAEGQALIAVLRDVGRLELMVSVALALGLWWSTQPGALA
ncbi:1,4-dihydroxy-2-naphthoate polyprenyltransferase [Serinibacter salmoneus]|uniref:1,4-dihydroxy-2-naphthoate octaprenyltransferase n=1 Tax=Serinibacter salmoneus TaxID=556530 RepID=A0A2A9D1K3_9MICO|nr:1,4-dihydroxy-2-naphthoate polyprenyltransferase [Serinibacter salmoneus]PFG20567.1 1,4-dihydroxy-2-naphthoate prenyltransferase [Serinibacter salmoneus]